MKNIMKMQSKLLLYIETACIRISSEQIREILYDSFMYTDCHIDHEPSIDTPPPSPGGGGEILLMFSNQQIHGRKIICMQSLYIPCVYMDTLDGHNIYTVTLQVGTRIQSCVHNQCTSVHVPSGVHSFVNDKKKTSF